MRIQVSVELCESNGVRVGMAPDLFDLDADGTLRVDADIASDRTAELQEIVDSCPRTALRLIP